MVRDVETLLRLPPAGELLNDQITVAMKAHDRARCDGHDKFGSFNNATVLGHIVAHRWTRADDPASFANFGTAFVDGITKGGGSSGIYGPTCSIKPDIKASRTHGL